MNLILPESMDAPTIPESFLRGLRDIDAGLVIYWNRFKNRFIIDRCTRTEPHTHGPQCERANVLIVEDPAGGFMMPSDHTLNRIKGMDAWSKFGGNDEAALLRQRRERENAKAAFDAKRKQEISQDWRDGLKDDKRQLQHAFDLIQRHDVARPHS